MLAGRTLPVVAVCDAVWRVGFVGSFILVYYGLAILLPRKREGFE